MKRIFTPILLLLLVTINTSAQELFESRILPLLQTNCGNNSNCHAGDNGAAWLTFDGDASDVYEALISAVPQNEFSANALRHYLVDPGYPERSLLYRKVNNNLHSDSELSDAEGDLMPPTGTPLADKEIELLRQWIYLGAPFDAPANADVETLLNEEAIEEFYEVGGISNESVPAPPSADEGFQLKFGPFFMEPDQEIEVLKLYDLRLEEGLEVNRIEVFMNDFSHHFIIYKYPNMPNVADGTRELEFSNAINSPIGGSGNSSFVSIWQDDQDFRLPEGTAYKWNAGTVLDLNYHLRNFSTTSVLAADVYINVYTQPISSATTEMFSELAIFGLDDSPIPLGIFDLNIPPGENLWFEEEFLDEPNTQVNMWMMSSHTHRLGKDYNIYLRNPDGSRGAHVFDGWFNSDYTIFQNFYDYEHPPVLFFDNFLEMPPTTGFIHEARYENNTSQPVTFGLTTDDEMFISILQFTLGENPQGNYQAREDIPETICLSDAPIELTMDGADGAVGAGVVSDMFHPAIAGVGSHKIVFNCCLPENMTERTITVLADAPEPSIVVDGAELEAISFGAQSYDWYLDGVLIAEDVEAITAVESGEYTAASILDGHCETFSEPVTILLSGLETIAFDVQPQVMPNPFETKSSLQFTLAEPKQNVNILVYDLSGKQIAQVFQGDLGTGEQKFELGEVLSEYGDGIFLLQIDMGGFEWTRKLIKR